MKSTLIALPAQVTLLTLLGGCASWMSGLGGSEQLSCKAPEGVICTSVSGVYANAANLAARSAPIPGLNVKPAQTDTYQRSVTAAPQMRAPAPSDGVMRSNPRVLRLWVAPWEDGDGDLYEASTVHVLIDNGRWLMDPIRPAPKSRIDAVAPPPGARPDNSTPSTAAETSASTAPTPFAATPAEVFSSMPR
jgi:conjugal transfer pilus assembly protein TraV